MARGSKPGERRGGRKKGSQNRVGQDVRKLARKYTKRAIETLAEIMEGAESEQARVMAADKLLDRGWGKPPQAITGEGGEGPARIIVEWAASSA